MQMTAATTNKDHQPLLGIKKLIVHEMTMTTKDRKTIIRNIN